MNKFVCLCALGVLTLPLQQAHAQDNSQAKPKVEERTKLVPIKVQVVFAEFDGDKKISSMPYSFVSVAKDRELENTSLRTGVRIPVEVDSKDQKTTYLDLGSNMDCRVRSMEDERFLVSLTFVRSELYPNKSAAGERLVSQPNGQPLIRQFNTIENFLLKDGQTAENALSTDPLNGHTMRLSVTINVLK